ncbi:MAG: radical SAM protein [Myxococcota bacterium]|jgi:hypothetical protein|nr:radical SAM protein [Myxococcota bacterium]
MTDSTKTTPVPMPWSGREVPHLTVEVNQCCNLDCHGCYKNRFNYQKTLAQVREEIDFAIGQRNLSTLTFAGGEPTLHPDLPAMISHAARQGVRVQVLTNASLLTPSLLREYKAAGLNRVAMHIDQGQSGRPDCAKDASQSEFVALRQHYIEMCVSAGVEVSPVLTLYKDALDDFPSMLERFHLHPHVSSMLVTAYSQDLNAHESTDDGLSVTNVDVAQMMRDKLGAAPSWCVPSTHDDHSYRWLFYTTAVTVGKDGRATKLDLDASNRLALKLLPKLDRLANGKYTYEETSPPLVAAFMCGLYGLSSLSPKKALQTGRFLATALRNRNLKIFGIVFQQAPNALANGDYEHCRDCPDATVRNGKLVPVCLVDKLEPLSCTPRA